MAYQLIGFTDYIPDYIYGTFIFLSVAIIQLDLQNISHEVFELDKRLIRNSGEQLFEIKLCVCEVFLKIFSGDQWDWN